MNDVLSLVIVAVLASIVWLVVRGLERLGEDR